MSIIVGSARIDENGKAKGGKAGDQKQVSNTNDTKGEVSMQNFYVHSKGWIIMRPKSIEHANAIASSMKTACNNPNIGYDQGERLGASKYGTDTDKPVETDCSNLARACIKEGTGKDPGNFTTANEVPVLSKTGLFEEPITFVSLEKTPVYNGDVLVTKTKGHTVVVVSGNPRKANDSKKENNSDTYYNKCASSYGSIVDALKSVGEKDTSLAHRERLAVINDVPTSNNVRMNTSLLKLLKQGKLLKG